MKVLLNTPSDGEKLILVPKLRITIEMRFHLYDVVPDLEGKTRVRKGTGQYGEKLRGVGSDEAILDRRIQTNAIVEVTVNTFLFVEGFQAEVRRVRAIGD